jgi:hypothetical protein
VLQDRSRASAAWRARSEHGAGQTVSPRETETKNPNGTSQTQGTKNAMICVQRQGQSPIGSRSSRCWGGRALLVDERGAGGRAGRDGARLGDAVLVLLAKVDDPEIVVHEEAHTGAEEKRLREFDEREVLEELVVYAVQRNAEERGEEGEPVEDKQQGVDDDHRDDRVLENLLGQARVLFRKFSHVCAARSGS